MRIVVWNCGMKFHEKLDALLALRPDVAIVPECASPDVPALAKAYEAKGLTGPIAWTGTWKHKGLGMLATGAFQVRHVRKGPPEAKHSLCVSIDGPQRLDVVAVWTHGPNYPGRVHAAVEAFGDVLRSGRAILAGDLNSNKKFDNFHGAWNHSAVVQELREHGLVSAFHKFHGCAQGEEDDHPTHRHRLKGSWWHLDYVFLPTAWKLDGARVENPAKWKMSDHFPLVVDVNEASMTEQLSGRALGTD